MNRELDIISVPVTTGCFEAFPNGSNVSDQTLERFRPVFSKELGGLVLNNPTSPVAFRTFQFYPLLDIEQQHAAEFGTNGHGPVDLISRKFVEKEGVNNTCDASFDSCVNHCRIVDNGKAKHIWAYMLMIPAWLAILTGAKECCFFKFKSNDVICADIDAFRTRFIVYYHFGLHSDERDSIETQINEETCIMIVVDHNLNSDSWSMHTKILTGYEKLME